MSKLYLTLRQVLERLLLGVQTVDRNNQAPQGMKMRPDIGRRLATSMLASAMSAIVVANANAQTQLELNNQAKSTFQAADANLNESYRKLASELSPPARASLVSTQRAWISFRDRECKFESIGVSNGSSKDMVVYDCLTSVTKSRIAQIEYQLNCPEGDLSCVVRSQ